MTIETVDGRPVYLRRTRFGWIVKWGRTVLVRCRTWREALAEIINIYAQA